MPIELIFVFLSSDWFDSPSTFRCGWTFDIRLDKQSRLEVETKNFSITCNITMETYSNSQLMVFFDALNISGYCPQNRVELHDGKSTRFPLIGGNIKGLNFFYCFCLFIIVYLSVCLFVCMIKLIGGPNWTFCNKTDETIKHLLWECESVKQFLNVTISWLSQYGIHIILKEKIFLFGIDPDQKMISID